MVHTDQYCVDIIPGKVKVNKYFESEITLAYYARNPEWPVHVIVIPKSHVKSLAEVVELADETAAKLIKDLAQVANMFQVQYGKCRVLTNTGENQHTKHLHWHVYKEQM